MSRSTNDRQNLRSQSFLVFKRCVTRRTFAMWLVALFGSCLGPGVIAQAVTSRPSWTQLTSASPSVRDGVSVAFGSSTGRIQTQVSGSEMSVLKGSLHPLAQAQYDAGAMPADPRFSGMTIVFSRSDAQQAALDALLAAQQDPASPLFHQWLTPDQFAAQFGMAQSDIEKVQTWLEQQGFSIDSVGRSRNMIHFSGSVGQVEQAFQTQMHYYNVEGAKHFAPSTELSLPNALASTVLAIRDLDNFKPRGMHIPVSARPSFTSGQSGSVFFAPGDIKIAYDMNPLLSQSINGSGQSIAIMGQSAI